MHLNDFSLWSAPPAGLFYAQNLKLKQFKIDLLKEKFMAHLVETMAFVGQTLGMV
jgi:hypothetical protein